MIKGFIFDFDGVIIDTNNYHFKSWKKSLSLFDIDFNEEIYNKIKGLSRKESLDFLTQNNHKIKESHKLELLNNKNEFFLDLIKHFSSDDLMPGVKDFIYNFKKNHKIGVASSSKNAKYILEKIKCDHFFDVIIDSNIVKESKPNPKVFLKCADFLNLKPEHCIVFEDSKNGILAAKRGGFLTYLVGNNEYNSLADKYIKDLTHYK